MKAVGDLLSQTLQGLSLRQRYNSEKVIFHWREIVGEKLAEQTRPEKIQRGLLTVATKSAVWAHHLMTVKEDIIAKINHFVGEKLISDIRFQAGYLKNDQNYEENKPEDDYPEVGWQKIKLNADEIAAVNRFTEPISDEQLRTKMVRLLRKEAVWRKAKEQQEWHVCRDCGVLCPPEYVRCTVCDINSRRQNNEQLRKLLLQAPWLGYQECRGYIDCRDNDYKTIKAEISDMVLKTIDFEKPDRMQLAILVMLNQGIRPDAIGDEHIDAILDKIRGKKHVFAPRR